MYIFGNQLQFTNFTNAG